MQLLNVIVYYVCFSSNSSYGGGGGGGVGGQDTSRHFESGFGSMRAILPQRKNWGRNQNLNLRK